MLNPFSALFKKSNQKKPRPSNIKPVLLLVLDGFGIAPSSEGNAISLAKKPNLTKYYKTFPHGEVIASGESVGLPANEVGNTEVGHLTLGAGRVIDQDLVRINKSIKDSSFYDNPAFADILERLKSKSTAKLHIAGLVGSGNVHSSMDHFWALMEFCKKHQIRNFYLHLFTDGRDSPPQEGISAVEKIEAFLKNNNMGKVATLSGRYYAMDRDGRWDRTKLAYDAMVLGRGVAAKSAVDAIKQSYLDGKTDEFIVPYVLTKEGGNPVATVDEDDAFFFFNFRIDRPRQLTMSFVLPDFENLKEYEFGKDPENDGKNAGKVKFEGGTFRREKVVKNLLFVTMTEYQKGLPVGGIAFPKIIVENTLGQVFSENGLYQLRMSESEKERFVTFYFNGQIEEPFSKEERLIVSSPKVATYDLKPEMSIFQLVSEFKKKANEGKYSFFLVNLANADMVGHTGNIPAATRAIEFIDQALGEMVEWVLALDGSVVVTADHGNVEEMLTYPTTSFFITTEKGKISTDHSNNPVLLLIASNKLRGKAYTLRQGVSSDIAPTVLDLAGLKIPSQMSGKSFLEEFRENSTS